MIVVFTGQVGTITRADLEAEYQHGYADGVDETGEERIDQMRLELCRALGLSKGTSWYAALEAARRV
jgi:hypothetical protein